MDAASIRFFNERYVGLLPPWQSAAQVTWHVGYNGQWLQQQLSLWFSSLNTIATSPQQQLDLTGSNDSVFTSYLYFCKYGL